MPPKQPFFEKCNLDIHLDLDDMTLTSWVLSKAICIPNMSIVTWKVSKLLSLQVKFSADRQTDRQMDGQTDGHR